MATGTEELPAEGSGELRKFQRLVELQSELVELARKNEQAEKECRVLWRELARDAERRSRKQPGSAGIAARLARLRQRLLADLRARINSAPERENLMRLSTK